MSNFFANGGIIGKSIHAARSTRVSIPQVVTTGLEFYYDAGNPESYSGSGNTWMDLSPNGVDATLTGTPIFDPNNGGSLTFTGSNYATINASGINFSTAQTIFMIFKPEEGDSARRNPYNQSYGGYGTMTHEPNGTINYFHGTNGGNGSPYQGTNSGFLINPNEIAVISLVRSSSAVEWYKNGELIRTQSNSYSSANSSTNTIYIAQGYVSRFVGKIYAVMAYSIALTSDEVKTNFDAFNGRFFI